MKIVRNILAVIGGIWVAGMVWDTVDEIRNRNRKYIEHHEEA